MIIIYKTLRNKQNLIRNSQQGWMINMALNYQEKLKRDKGYTKQKLKQTHRNWIHTFGNKNEKKKTQKGYKIHPWNTSIVIYNFMAPCYWFFFLQTPLQL